jgi:hypothetical protein
MRSIFIILVTCIGFLYGCKKSSDAKTQSPLEIRLDDCFNGDFSGDQIRLCFDSVLSDSRCPANVLCVWQGTAVAKFLFTKNTEAHTIVLATFPLPGAYSKDTIVSGYKIEFLNLTPYPGAPPLPPHGNEIWAEVKITKL